ncbi:fatty acid desaturase [Nodosilinea sp. E11]|uniref:fatty acid desaturase n=1 Tax=Nodosilinea sp. E11 TaxID=3037479 RepID=UPI002934FC9B|nr:fatty acid desaturase [Nodosilinea sp. E11]WOD39651.1 fatty acid desaturase [Nodosilinea sp. E11]
MGTFTLFSAQTPLAYWLWAILIRTFLHTGLFIVTHEAIHRNISNLHGLNDAFGYITSWLYALLPYQLLAKNHRLHHRFPATEQDPDHHKLNRGGFWLWYIQFMKTYQTGGQVWVSLIGISLIFCAFIICHIPAINLILFWIIPMVLSSLQLFTFGIFLPHRQRDNAPEYDNTINSIHLPVFWSFITCYHFGYHQEHHLKPHLPWYQLPQAYRSSKV